METALTLTSPPELTVSEGEKAQLSALVQAKIVETETVTVVSTDAQFEAAGEELRAIAELRSQMESAVKPYITFWHQGHKTHTQLLATLDGPLEARERSIKQGLSRGTSGRRRKRGAGKKSGCGGKRKSCAGSWKRKIAGGGKWRPKPLGGDLKKKHWPKLQPAKLQAITKRQR